MANLLSSSIICQFFQMCVCVCLQLLQKPQFSCCSFLQQRLRFISVIGSKRVRRASNKQQKTTHFLSMYLFVSLPLHHIGLPSPNLSLSQLISFSAFAAPTYTALSVSPPHILSPLCLSPSYSLSILSSFHIPLLSPPTFPSLSDVLLGRLKLCVVVMKRTEGQERAQQFYTHTHGKCP